MSNALTGDYLSLAEACGETIHYRGWVAGKDFDPDDEFEMDVMALVWENEAYETQTRIARENESLRAENRNLQIRLLMLENGLTEDEAREAIEDGQSSYDDDI